MQRRRCSWSNDTTLRIPDMTAFTVRSTHFQHIKLLLGKLAFCFLFLFLFFVFRFFPLSLSPYHVHTNVDKSLYYYLKTLSNFRRYCPAYSVSQYDAISDESPSAVLNNHKINYIHYQTRDLSNQSRHIDQATQTDASWFASVVKLKDF